MMQSAFDFERAAEDALGAVSEYLQAHARGPAHAKTRRQIEQALSSVLGTNCERLLRAVANRASRAGLPIVTTNDGYHWASHFDDFEPMLARLRHQRDQMHARIVAVEQLRKRLFHNE